MKSIQVNESSEKQHHLNPILFLIKIKLLIFFHYFYISFTVFLLLVEHNLGIASGVYVSKSCWGVHSAEEAYFRQSFTDFFASFKFNIYLGLFAQIVNLFWYVKELGNVKGIENQFLLLFLYSQRIRMELH